MGGEGLLNGHAKIPKSENIRVWEKLHPVQLGPVAGQDAEGVINLVLLAWALLLRRDYGKDEHALEACFCWERSYTGSPSPSKSPMSLGKLNWRDTDRISTCLGDVRTSRQKTVLGEKAAEGEVDSQAIFLAISNSGEDSISSHKFCLEIQFSDGKVSLRPCRDFWTTSENEASRYTDAFADIFESISVNQEQSVAESIQIGRREVSQLWKWNETLPPQVDRCMHDIFAEIAQREPGRPAVVSWDGELSYGEVHRLSSHLAGILSDMGVRLGMLVPLCFEKSVWTVVAVLAVMKAGGGVVLTDPKQPEARLQTIAAEVDAEVVVTSRQKAALGSLIAPTAKLVVVEPDLFQQHEESKTSVLQPVPASAIMYVVFTSGSTGKPKGVVISHTNYTSGALPRAQKVGYMESSRVLDFPSYAFDVSFDCMLCTLACGGCICVPSDEARVNDLDGAIRGMKVNMAHMTPSVARVLEADVMESLRTLGLGGEALSVSDAAVWSKKTKIVNAYGPSECTVGCAINEDVKGERPYMTLGRGVGAVTWIVDPVDHNLLSPIGTPGELLVEGPIVGEGYLNDPDKTSQAFILDPVWLLAGERGTHGRHGRLYKTGDIVKYDPDGSGCLVFVGRKDRQVKLRGQRVELAEVEHHLRLKLPQGTSIAAEVITPGSVSSEPTLVAFVVEHRQNGSKASTGPASFSPNFRQALSEIEIALTAELPVYMVPTAFIPLWQMPLMVSCKVDRKILREIGLGMSKKELSRFRANDAQQHDQPTTEMERKLHGLWARSFGDGLDIGRHDNYFALGGDSLKAMKLVAAARAEGFSLSVAAIFNHPRLADMALALRPIAGEKELEIPAFSLLSTGWAPDSAQSEAARLCNVDLSLVEDVYPCAPLQEGFMALSAKLSDGYIAQRVVKLASSETAFRLQRAFDVVIATCPILRTRIVQVSDRGLMQVVIKGQMSWHSGSDIEEYLAQDRASGMNLGEPLARLALIADNETGAGSIVLTIHHAIYDGWSMPLIVDRVKLAYRGMESGPPPPFRAFIRYLRDTKPVDQEAFWRKQLDGANGLQFPVVPEPDYQPQADALLEHYVTLDKPLGSNTTFATAIRGAWALIAAKYTASDDVVFGETLTGRNVSIPGVEAIEGPMITTVPTRISIDRNLSASEYLKDIFVHTIDRIPFEHMGLQHIRRLSSDAREACDLRTCLVLHPVTEGETSPAEDDPASGFVPPDDAEAAREALKFNSYGLMLVCTLDPKGFLIMASFDSRLVDKALMEKILIEFEDTVQRLCEATETISNLLNQEPNLDLVWRLSSIGASKIQASELYNDALATWIAHPADSEKLLPVGAVGELWIETLTDSSRAPVQSPAWYMKGCRDGPKRETKLCKTGLLAKYSSEGNIVFIQRRLVNSKPKSVVKPRNPSKELSQTTKTRSEKLSRLWSRLLRVARDDIGPSDSFFDLGGDSIAAMKLVSELQLEGLKLSVAQIFQHRLFSDMLEVIETSTSQTPAKEATPFSALGLDLPEAFVADIVRPKLEQATWQVVDILPARPLQRIAVKGTVQLPRFSARYELLYFDGAIDRDRLCKSCQQLISRNEILRTVFIEHTGLCLSVVLKELDLSLVEHETDGDLETFSHQLCEADIQTEMPLGSAFVKFMLVRSKAGPSCLIFRLSHAQYDEICLPILLRQLSNLYEEKSCSEVVPFSSFVYHVLRVSIPGSIGYWKQLLEGSSMTALGTDLHPPSRQVIAISRTHDISNRPKEITVATLPTAAWALCLARHLSVQDVTFGEVVSGRNLNFRNCDTVVGPCWQYVPVRIRLDPAWNALELLRSVQTQHITSAQFEGIGLEEVIKQCTDWPPTVEWFDSVVHQDVAHVEQLPFTAATCRLETVYPHAEPLREWKIQAFHQGKSLTLEIVTFEANKELALSLLDELDRIMSLLMTDPTLKILGN